MKHFQNKTILLILLLMVLAFTIRLIGINLYTMYGDELTMVYDGYSILNTGHDQLGNFLPLTFPMGAGRPGGYIYFSIPFIYLFGPTAMGIRLLSFLSGLFLILLMFLLGLRLINKNFGLIAAFLTTLSPWAISLSRVGLEANFALFLSILGIVAFLYAREKPWLYIVWGFSWGLALHTYPVFKLLLPLFFISLVWYTRGITNLGKWIKNLMFVLGLFVFVVFGILALSQSIWGNSEQRFFSINIFAQDEVRSRIINNITYNRNISPLPDLVKPIFYNKALEYFKILLSSYLINFSPNFIFIEGDGNPVHNMAEMGAVYWSEIITLTLGIFFLFKQRRREFYLFGGWFITSPLAATLLGETHGLRSAFMLPSLIFISGYGVFLLLTASFKYKKIFISSLILFYTIQIGLMFNNLYFQNADKNARSWGYPAKMAVDIVNQAKDKYDYIILSSKIENVEYAYLVYNRIDPWVAVDQYNNFLEYKEYNNVIFSGINVLGDLDKYNFLTGRILFVGDYLNDRQMFDKYDTFYLKDYSPILISAEISL